MGDKFLVSKATGVHHQLNQLAGDWEGITKTWLDPEKSPDESPVTATMRPVLGGRFILHEYKGKLGDKSLEGMAIYGYHLGLQKIQCAWIDSFHNGTAIMFSEGSRGGTDLTMLGSYAYITPEMEQHWGWRTHIEIKNDMEFVITAYNISPEGEAVKATETIYRKRIKNSL